MGKTLDTKKKILDYIGNGKKTLTEISDELDLAPSTVNQHIKELLDMGAITQVNNPFIKKWKYYERNTNFSFETLRVNGIMAKPMFKVATGIAAITIIALAIVFFAGASPAAPIASQVYLGPGQVPNGVTVLSVSDAPTVSSISSVNLTATSAEIHSTTTGKWYLLFNSSKPFDLVKLRNISQLITGANIPTGTYDELTLEISNATATVNNQTENVSLPSGDIKIFGKFNISGNTTTWINLDINLNRSVHVTGNGKVILIPVINVNNFNGATLDVASSGIINVSSPGHLREHIETSMDTNGAMHMGANAVPVSEPLEVNGRGAITVNETANGMGMISISIRTPHKLIIVTDGNATITNESGNFTKIINITVDSMQRTVVCNGFGRSVFCTANTEIGEHGAVAIAANATERTITVMPTIGNSIDRSEPGSNMTANATGNASEGTGMSSGMGTVRGKTDADVGANAPINGSVSISLPSG